MGSQNFIDCNNISNMLRYLYEKSPHNNRNGEQVALVVPPMPLVGQQCPH